MHIDEFDLSCMHRNVIQVFYNARENVNYILVYITPE